MVGKRGYGEFFTIIDYSLDEGAWHASYAVLRDALVHFHVLYHFLQGALQLVKCTHTEDYGW